MTLEKNLDEELADLYNDQASIIRLIRGIGLNPVNFRLDGTVINIWSDVVDKVRKMAKLQELLNLALREFPNRYRLQKAIEEEALAEIAVPEITNLDDGEKKHLQKMIKTKTRRLQIRQQQEAYNGPVADPSISMEIEDIQEQLEQLENRLKYQDIN